MVSYKSEPTANFQEVFQLPVATNDAGTYETSWTVPHQRAPSGEYKLQFFREVDRLRAEDKTKKDTAEDIKPLFELTMSHTVCVERCANMLHRLLQLDSFQLEPSLSQFFYWLQHLELFHFRSLSTSNNIIYCATTFVP